MPRIAYREQNFRQAALDKLDQANAILREYAAQGYELTLRQLYYQFVARGLIANTQREYKNLGNVISDGRYAGIIDWNDITDRTRYVREQPSWNDPSQIVRGAAAQYQIDLWEGQANHVEVWVEKDALVGVIERACAQNRLPFLSCRGYVSASEMWSSAQRLGRIIDGGQTVHLLHLGDHDPSGIDMSRDIEDRITEFLWGDGRNGAEFHLSRIALNMDQVDQYNPPPNPAKITDSRAGGYIALHGDESWELDALEPSVIDQLINVEANQLIDHNLMDERREIEAEEKEILQATSDRWEEVKAFLA